MLKCVKKIISYFVGRVLKGCPCYFGYIPKRMYLRKMERKLPIEAKRFKKVREELKYTQHSFAELLKIGSTTADIERGKTKITGKVVAKFDMFYPNLAGLLATKGGLIFSASPEGSVFALDSDNLKELWRFETNHGTNAPPITFYFLSKGSYFKVFVFENIFFLSELSTFAR